MADKVTITYKPPLPYWKKFFNEEISEQAMREELNAVARKARTQLRRKLAEQTKIPYGEISQAVTLRPAYKGNLTAVLRVRDKVPTLGRFMTSFTRRPKGFKAQFLWRQTMRLRVWGGMQTFPVRSIKPFVLPGTRLIVVREGKGRRAKLRALSGPNLAGGKPETGEIQRGQTKTYVQIELPAEFSQRVLARIERIMKA